MSSNPCIFKYDYKRIKEINIFEYFFKPKFIVKFLKKYEEFINEEHYINWFLIERDS